MASIPYQALAFLLIASAFLGGSDRGDVQSLIVLRPLAAVMLGLGLWRLRITHVRAHGFIVAMALAITALPALQLVSLPHSLWSQLPGRAQIMDIDGVAGLGQISRPLSLAPDATLNALLSLLVPLATLVLGLSLSPRERLRLLPLVIAVGATSAVIALEQIVAGPASRLYFYEITNFGSTVGLFANRNHQALLLVTMLPMLAYWGGGRDNATPLKKLGALLAGMMILPLVLITGSRAGLIAGAVAVLSIPLLLPGMKFSAPGPGVTSAPRTRVLVNAARAGPMGLAFVIALALAALTIWLGRAEAWDRIIGSSVADEGRIRIMPTLVSAVRFYYPWGSGMGTFEEVFQVHEPDTLLTTTYMNHAHNDWLELFLTGGAPAAILAMLAVAALSYSLARSLFAASAIYAEARLARLGNTLVILIALASLGDYPLRTPCLSSLFVIAVLWASTPPPRNLTGTPPEITGRDVGPSSALEPMPEVSDGEELAGITR